MKPVFKVLRCDGDYAEVVSSTGERSSLHFLFRKAVNLVFKDGIVLGKHWK